MKYIIPSVATDCLEQMPRDHAAPIIMHLDIERAAALLRRMPESNRDQLIKATSPLFANMVRLVLRYPDGTVGQVMDPHVFTVHQDMRVAEVSNAVRNAPGQLRHEVYVIDDKQQPVGVVAFRQLLTSRGKEVIKNIMHPVGQTVAARTSLSLARNSVDWESKDSIPVVDHQGVLLGILFRGNLNANGTDVNVQDEYTGTALAVAELFWEACSHLLLPVSSNEEKGSPHE